MNKKLIIAIIATLAITIAGSLAIWKFHYQPKAQLEQASSDYTNSVNAYAKIVEESQKATEEAKELDINELGVCEEYTAKTELTEITQYESEKQKVEKLQAECKNVIAKNGELVKSAKANAQILINTEKTNALHTIKEAQTLLSSAPDNAKAELNKAIDNTQKAVDSTSSVKDVKKIKEALATLDKAIRQAKESKPSSTPAPSEPAPSRHRRLLSAKKPM